MIAVLDTSAAVEIILRKKSADKLGEGILKADWVISP